jgi:hypothetical protein
MQTPGAGSIQETCRGESEGILGTERGGGAGFRSTRCRRASGSPLGEPDAPGVTGPADGRALYASGSAVAHDHLIVLHDNWHLAPASGLLEHFLQLALVLLDVEIPVVLVGLTGLGGVGSSRFAVDDGLLAHKSSMSLQDWQPSRSGGVRRQPPVPREGRMPDRRSFRCIKHTMGIFNANRKGGLRPGKRRVRGA